jgi:hypothetical protein
VVAGKAEEMATAVVATAAATAAAAVVGKVVVGKVVAAKVAVAEEATVAVGAAMARVAGATEEEVDWETAVVATEAEAVAVRVGATAREAVGMVAAAEVPVEARVAVATPDRAA